MLHIPSMWQRQNWKQYKDHWLPVGGRRRRVSRWRTRYFRKYLVWYYNGGFYICPSPQMCSARNESFCKPWTSGDYTCHCTSITCNKCTPLVGDVDSGVGYACMRAESRWDISVLSFQFYENLKIIKDCCFKSQVLGKYLVNKGQQYFWINESINEWMTREWFTSNYVVQDPDSLFVEFIW